jgi:hypothetical protein
MTKWALLKIRIFGIIENTPKIKNIALEIKQVGKSSR